LTVAFFAVKDTPVFNTGTPAKAAGLAVAFRSVQNFMVFPGKGVYATCFVKQSKMGLNAVS
jgi:hypothetical protein